MSVLQTVSCPNCGAAHDLRNLAFIQVTCEFCESIYIWDTKGVEDTGKKARLIPAVSGLAIGAEGRLHEKRFTVIGRASYAYGEFPEKSPAKNKDGESESRTSDAAASKAAANDSAPESEPQKRRIRDLEIHGKWDEWFIELETDERLWLSEDMGRLIEERALPAPAELSVLRTGERFEFEGETFVLRETGTAFCIGTEGDLPFQVLPEDSYPFADATSLSGKRFLTLELDQDEETGDAFLYAGKRLKKDEIQYEKADYDKDALEGKSINCPSCGSPNNPLGESRSVLTIVCPSCGEGIDISRETALALGRVEEKLAKVFSFPLGARGVLKGVEWTITGRIRYEYKTGPYDGWSLEYLLFNHAEGYRWLSQSDEGRFLLGGPVDFAPGKSLFSVKESGKKVKIRKEKYTLMESGELTVRYVDGALPWRARLEEKVRYAEAEAPPYVFTEEAAMPGEDGGEIEYFYSKKISGEKVKSAFGVSSPPAS